MKHAYTTKTINTQLKYFSWQSFVIIIIIIFMTTAVKILRAKNNLFYLDDQVCCVGVHLLRGLGPINNSLWPDSRIRLSASTFNRLKPVCQ